MTPNIASSFAGMSDGNLSDFQSAFSDSDDVQGRERMEVRRNSPKIKRRKKRSKLPVEPISLTEEDDARFYQSSKSAQEVHCVLRESTARLQRATDGFLQAAEALVASQDPSHGSLEELFADQGHPVSNEIKDAIDDGFYSLTVHYTNHYLGSSSEKLDLEPLREQIKALLTAFLPLPLLPEKFMEVASFFAYIQQESSSLSTEDHAVALFYNVVRYIGEHQQHDYYGETLDCLAEPMDMMFCKRRALLRELLRSSGVWEHIEACRGTRMYTVLNLSNQRGKKMGLRAFKS